MTSDHCSFEGLSSRDNKQTHNSLSANVIFHMNCWRCWPELQWGQSAFKVGSLPTFLC